ncbi:hypothetical protein [Dyella sp. 333MFSha]|uniref:hypothetical protein n=1 Tax=Dyella sp. 333MFSha TaxID=1798240 RepID=UPI000886DBAA|nr:hypothetical protein [Dyella sp. 333MFSha]SDF93173.1 hypothetical protein SAMN04515659_1665 [Dyella sp. 333MFSha]
MRFSDDDQMPACQPVAIAGQSVVTASNSGRRFRDHGHAMNIASHSRAEIGGEDTSAQERARGPLEDFPAAGGRVALGGYG